MGSHRSSPRGGCGGDLREHQAVVANVPLTYPASPVEGWVHGNRVLEEAGSAPEEPTVVDLAPTVLHAVGEPVGRAMDGRVLHEVLAPPVTDRPVATTAYEEDGRRAEAPDGADYDDVEERLRGLGYIE